MKGPNPMQSDRQIEQTPVGQLLKKITHFGVIGGGYLLLITAIMISVDVLIRKLFSVTLTGAAELSGFAFAVSASWAFGFAVFRRAHVRVDVLYRLSPSPVRAVLDVFSMLVLATVSCLITWFVTGLLIESIELGAESALLRLPIWIPQTLCSLGLTLFSLTAVYQALRVLLALLKREYQKVQNEAGATTE